MDLMEMVKNAINSQATGHIATALGTDAQTATKAINGAIPAILGGLIKQASTPTGASNLFGVLDKVDPGILNDLGSALSGGKVQSVIEAGTKLLPTVFGSNYSTVLGTLGKLTGLGSGKIGPLLGMLVPIVMGVLAKIKNTSGLDLAGFTRMLIDQQKNLSGLDSGLAEQLGVGNLADTVQLSTATVGKSLSKVAEVSRPVASRGGISVSAWLIPLLALAAVALALYLFVFTRDGGVVPAKYPAPNAPQVSGGGMIPGTRAQPAQEPPPAKETEDPVKSSAENPTKAITDFLAEASKSFAEIKDEAGAKTAAESLQKLAGKVDSLGLDKLAGPAKAVVGAAIKKFLEDAKTWAEKAYATPGVKEVLEPAVNAIVEKLKGFAE